MTRRGRCEATAAGFTLLEIVVVLVVLGIASAIVAPVWLAPRAPGVSPVAALLRDTQRAAARRGETLYLSIAAGGRWRVDGVLEGELLATGTLDGFRGPAGTLVVSPLGTCGFDARSGAAARALGIDPLRCEPPDQ